MLATRNKYFDYCPMFQEGKLGVKLEETGKQIGL